MNAPVAPNRWAGAWLDATAFALGLGLAWWQAWNTTDLVWSLWLSSLVVGYAMIVWRVSEPLRDAAQGIAADQGTVAPGAKLAVLALYGVGTLFGLAFFTVHFGGFHFVHSVFLELFFPIERDGHVLRGFPTLALYTDVVRRYWWFLPVAFLAERAAFLPNPAGPPDTAVTPEAIKARLRRGDTMMEPYKNVIRMHLLIFFFAFAHFARLENFAVYAVVYAAYFFPWRSLRPAAARS
jgi:hypothetical protein